MRGGEQQVLFGRLVPGRARTHRDYPCATQVAPGGRGWVGSFCPRAASALVTNPPTPPVTLTHTHTHMLGLPWLWGLGGLSRLLLEGSPDTVAWELFQGFGTALWHLPLDEHPGPEDRAAGPSAHPLLEVLSPTGAVGQASASWVPRLRTISPMGMAVP